MQSQDIMELLSDIIADTERERADVDTDPSIIILKAVTSDLYQKIFQNMIP